MSPAKTVTVAVRGATSDTERAVQCLLMCGHLAVTPHQRYDWDRRRRPTYTVTHVRTGYAVVTDVTKIVATRLVRLVGAHPLWDFGPSDLHEGAARVRDSEVWPAIVAARDWRSR